MKSCLNLTLLLGLYLGWSQEKVPLIQYSDIAKLVKESSQSGDFDKTLSQLDKVHKNDSAICSVLVTKSYYFLVKKEYDRALSVIDSGLTKKCSESRGDLLINKAVALIGNEDYEESIQLQEAALKEYPKSHLLWYNYAFALEKSNRLEEAAKAYQQTILINPLYKKSYLQLGNICYKQQRFALALMCFNMVLLIEPDSGDALGILKSLNEVVKSRNENERKPGVALSEDEDSFGEIDLILTNRISLNEKYETGNAMDLAIVRQNHAFLASLGSTTIQKGFWSERFVPFYRWIQENGYFDLFIYTLAYSIENEVYKKIIDKNRDEIIEFRKLALSNWLEFVKKDTRNWYGETKDVTFYFNNGVLEGVGLLEGGIAIGPWEFYDNNGRISATGSFDSKGNRTGKWTWFYENNQVKEITSYTEGKIQGESLDYYKNGYLKLKSYYRDNILEGPYEFYNNKGALQQRSAYTKGELEGLYTSYYPDGEAIQYEIPYHGNAVHGKVVQYFPNGKVLEEIEFLNGQRHGREIQYNIDGKVISLQTYSNGLLEGEIIQYHPNGKIKEKGLAIAGNYNGIWKSYYRDGTLKTSNQYKEGYLEGTSQTFDDDGILHFEYEYKGGEVVAYRFYDKSGGIIREARKKGGEFQYQGFTPSGIMDAEGLYDIKGGKKGEWSYYTAYGNLSSRSTFIDNALHGKSYEYYANGELSEVTSYSNDSLSGYYTEYFKNGQTRNQGWFVDNNKQGEWRSYYVDGTLESVVYYHKGQLHGQQENYAVDGSPESTTLYDFGELTKELYYNQPGHLQDSILYENKEPEYAITINHSNQKPKFNMEFSHGVKDGLYTYYNFYGNKRIEGSYDNGETEGKWSWYHENGQIERTATYSRGELHGPVIDLYDNGQIESESYFRFGMADSTWISYDENGNKIIITEYEMDEPHGRKEFYSEEGILQLVRFYKHGILTGYSYLNAEGEELPMIPLLNGNGIIKAYYPNGKVSREMEYRNGDLVGLYKHYDDTGQILEEFPYTANEYHGTMKTYHRNGRVKNEQTYFFGYKHGRSLEYFDTGKLKKEDNFRNDLQHGESKTYDASGKLINNEIYFNGEIVAVSKV